MHRRTRRVWIVSLAVASWIGSGASTASAAPEPSVDIDSGAQELTDAATVAATNHCTTCNTQGYFGLCFWVDKNYNDGPGNLNGNNPWWGSFRHNSCKPPHAASTAIWPFPPARGNPTWNDCVSSVCNCKPGYYALLYRDYAYRGSSYFLPSLTCMPNLQNTGYNDAISSNKFYPIPRSGLSLNDDGAKPPRALADKVSVLRGAGWRWLPRTAHGIAYYPRTHEALSRSELRRLTLEEIEARARTAPPRSSAE